MQPEREDCKAGLESVLAESLGRLASSSLTQNSAGNSGVGFPGLMLRFFSSSNRLRPLIVGWPDISATSSSAIG